MLNKLGMYENTFWIMLKLTLLTWNILRCFLSRSLLFRRHNLQTHFRKTVKFLYYDCDLLQSNHTGVMSQFDMKMSYFGPSGLNKKCNFINTIQ